MKFRENLRLEQDWSKIGSGVAMDIAAFKVGHSSGIDKDATALRAARARSSSIGAMEELSGKV